MDRQRWYNANIVLLLLQVIYICCVFFYFFKDQKLLIRFSRNVYSYLYI